MVPEIKIRFSANGQCRQCVIDFITQYLSDRLYDYEDLKNLRTNTDTIRFLKDNGFKFVLCLSWMSLLSPITWMQLIRYRKRLSFGKGYFKHKKKIELLGVIHGILYHATPKQLYKIDGEFWTHWIAVIQKKDLPLVVFDPLLELLTSSTNNIVRITTVPEIESKAKVKILIWKEG